MRLGTGVIGGQQTEVVFVASGINTSSPLNTFSKSGQSLGAEHPSRQIILLAYGNNANLVTDQNYTTGVTIGGVSAARKAAPTGNQIAHLTGWITPRADSGGPTGTTGTIAVQRSTGNGFTTVCYVAFAVYFLRGSEPVGSLVVVADTPPSGTLPLAGGGLLTAMATASDNGPFTWTGADAASDEHGGVGSGSHWSAALLNSTAASAAHLVSADNVSSFERMIAVSWR